MKENGIIKASVTVTNTGKREGSEIVQLYIRDREASITRPVKELKGFKKITLKAGESREITFDITSELLKYYDPNLEYICDAGEFDIMIGSSSADVKSTMLTLE